MLKNVTISMNNIRIRIKLSHFGPLHLHFVFVFLKFNYYILSQQGFHSFTLAKIRLKVVNDNM